MADAVHLYVDPSRRLAEGAKSSGFYVRATDEHGHGVTVAIEELDKASVLVYLRSRCSYAFIEDVVGGVLGHGRLNKPDPRNYNRTAPVPELAVDDALSRIAMLVGCPADDGEAVFAEVEQRLAALDEDLDDMLDAMTKGTHEYLQRRNSPPPVDESWFAELSALGAVVEIDGEPVWTPLGLQLRRRARQGPGRSR